MILFLFIFTLACVVLTIAMHQILLKGREEYIVVFACLYLPFYTTILSVVYKQTGSALAVGVFQYSKELIVLLAIVAFVLYKRDFFAYGFKLLLIDYVFIIFLGLAMAFVVLPIGAASLLQKVLYFKNIAVLGIMYFFGRNARLEDVKVGTISKVIFGIAIAAFLLNLFEYYTDTHFQSTTGYALFNEAINKKEPEGSFYLTWTFETQTGQKRFASFFSNPLELASAVMLMFPMALIYFLKESNPVKKLLYTAVVFCTIGSLVLAFSRASLAALFVQLTFIAFILRYYKIIYGMAFLAAVAGIYLTYFASRDLQDFIYDTVTFQNASSVGHLVEWFQGIESMINSPQGIGLAMSGNAASVDDSSKVGGENQFIIFGVQLGVFGLFLYCLLLFLAVLYSLRAYRSAHSAEDRVIPFTAAAAKVGLLLPLFTSNVEIYLFVAYVSWWMVGYSVSMSRRNKFHSRPGIQ